MYYKIATIQSNTMVLVSIERRDWWLAMKCLIVKFEAIDAIIQSN